MRLYRGARSMALGSRVSCEPESQELPAVVRVKEAPVSGPNVFGPRRTRAAAHDELVAHEFAVVLAEGSRERLESRELPFGLRRQPRAGPTRERVGFVEAHVAHGRMLIDRAPAAERELARCVLRPAERAAPAELAHFRPAVREPERGLVIAA